MKHLTIISHSPEGTLGEPALCAVLVEGLLKQHPDLKIKIVFASVNKVGHWRSVDNIIPHHDNIDVEFFPGSINLLSVEQKQEIYDNTDAVIVYPSFFFNKEETKKELEELNQHKPVLFGTTYNLTSSYKLQYDEKNNEYMKSHPTEKLSSYQQLLDQHMIIETGIGKNHMGDKMMGFNLSDKERDKTVDLDNKDKNNLNNSDLKSIRGILQLSKNEALDNNALTKYKSQNDLYFGYYNNLPAQADNNWANGPNFVKLAVMDSIQKNTEKKNIDIVIPLRDNEASIASGNNFKNIVNKLDLQKVTVEVWEKNPTTGELEKKKSEGNGATTVRLINAFPFASNSMDLMYRMSEPLTLVTGNSSLAETIDYDKIPLYQMMSWATELDSNLLAEITSDPPFNQAHPYRQFNELIRSNDPNKEEKLATLLKNNREQILAGAKVFHSHLILHYNLKENLPKEITRRIELRQQEIQQNATSPQRAIDQTKDEIPQEFRDFNNELEHDYNNFKDNNVLNARTKNDLLLLAFIRNDLNFARKLLKQGADPNYTKEINGNKYNPLFFCIHHRLDEKLLNELHNNKFFDPILSMDIIRENLSILEGEPVTNVNPYQKMLDAFPKHKMMDMLIKSANNLGKDPKKLFKGQEIYRFFTFDKERHSEDIVFLDILIRENVISPKSSIFYNASGISDFYEENYAYKLTEFIEKQNWPDVLKMSESAKFSSNALPTWKGLFEKGYEKHKGDKEFLRKVFLTPDNNGFNLLNDLMFRFPDYPMVELVAKDILSANELTECRRALEKRKIIEKIHKLEAQKENFDLSGYGNEADMKAVDIELARLKKVIASNQNAFIYELMDKLDSIKVYNERAEKVLYGEGGLLTISGYNYIRKLQLETALRTGAPLKKVFLLPENHPKLNVPVFIGENSEPICLYAKNSFDAGHFGNVYLGLRVDTGEACIIKRQAVNKVAMDETKALKGLKSHIETYQFTDNNAQYQLEAQKRIGGQNLKRIIQDKNGARVDIPENVRLNMLSHVANAVCEFHQQGWLHRDITLENIMCNPKTGQCGLVDLGFTVQAKNLQYKDNAAVGKLFYRPPEILDPNATEFVYNEETEVYSLGIVFAILNSNQTIDDLTAKVDARLKTALGEDMTKIPQAIREALPEIFNEYVTAKSPIQAQMNELIKKMTDPDPSKRPKMSEVNDVLNKLQHGQTLEDHKMQTTKSAEHPAVKAEKDPSSHRRHLSFKNPTIEQPEVKNVLREKRIESDVSDKPEDLHVPQTQKPDNR